MTAMLVSINGVAFPTQPHDLSIEKYDLTKSGRVASGSMTIDIIAKKIKFTLSWEVISGRDMEAINAIVDSFTAFYTLVYVENGVTKSVVVYAGAKKATRFRTDGVWYWKNFTFDLIQK